MTLPITAMLEERIKIQEKYIEHHMQVGSDAIAANNRKDELFHVLSEVRTLEEAQEKKAKEEERERILEILNERYDIEGVGLGIPISIEEAIERISN